jgi:hypothetical protein
MKRGRSIVLAAVAVVVLGGIYFTRTGDAPADQPSLVEVNNATLAAMRDEFNRTADKLRVILLLSPT